jgi:hypothetical protein
MADRALNPIQPHRIDGVVGISLPFWGAPKWGVTSITNRGSRNYRQSGSIWNSEQPGLPSIICLRIDESHP